jgi:DNA-binding response OmpR family regulator
MARILMVDDERRIVSFVSRALSASGVGVDGAYDGEQGLALARTGIYDLVILDLLLPGLDGISVLRGIVEARPHQQVLILSALSDATDKVECLKLGAADYLAKPFSLAELTARVGVRLRERSSKRPEAVATTCGIALDRRRRLADAGAGRVHLSEREFLLLQHLMDNDGEVCTREELLADVWGYTFDPGSNVVEVYVSRLRAKLAVDVIETIRNVGYCLRHA